MAQAKKEEGTKQGSKAAGVETPAAEQKKLDAQLKKADKLIDNGKVEEAEKILSEIDVDKIPQVVSEKLEKAKHPFTDEELKEFIDGSIESADFDAALENARAIQDEGLKANALILVKDAEDEWKKENSKPVQMTDEQRKDYNERIANINKLQEKELWDKAKKEIEDLPDFGFDGLKESRAQLKKDLYLAKRRTNDRKKADEKKLKEDKHLTLESIEDRLFNLISDVEELTKLRAKMGKPNRQLAILKRRLDVLALHYMKFKKRSKD